jgi:hypothetical protein
LQPNVPAADTIAIELPLATDVTQPYWLRLPSSPGLTRVADRADLGQPENRPALTARFKLDMAGETVTYTLPVAYRWVDAVQGERWRQLEVSPPGTLAFEQPFQLFADATPRTVRVTVRAQKNKLAGTLRLELPAGWNARPASVPVAIEVEGKEQAAEFVLTPGREGGTARAVLDVDGHAWSMGAQRIDYPHIPVQTLFPPAELKLVRTDLNVVAGRVGYIAGSGDQIADALRQMGCSVTPLSDDDVASGDLSRFDAIVTGVRAYNTRPRLRTAQKRLLDWAAKGGTLVVQYVTTADGTVDYLGPLPFRVSRDRVTVEDAPITFLKPQNRLLTAPNKLGPADFAGWVQERGLYFAEKWDRHYQTPLAMNDPGEKPLAGSLLWARYGKGTFVYTGLAFFRQLPAGVPGAFRLFANLMAHGKAPRVH